MPRLKLVQQIGETDCGIACLAMVTHQSYEETKARLSEQLSWSSAKKTNFKTHAHQLTTFLINLKLGAEQVKFTGWDDICGTTLLGVKLKKDQKGYHWIIVVKNSTGFLILDPLEARIYHGREPKKGYLTNPRSACIKLTIL